LGFGIDRCDAIFLGPDIGFVNVMEYHDDDESCKISMTELASVCSQFLEECLAFLASSEGMPPKCDAIFLGPDIGFVDVFTYHDDDKSCKCAGIVEFVLALRLTMSAWCHLQAEHAGALGRVHAVLHRVHVVPGVE
jgi:hypothetical protein